MFYMIATSVLLFYFAVSMVIFFMLRTIMREWFGRVKHFFLKNKGYGWVFVIKQNRTLQRYFLNLENDKFEIGDKTYYNDANSQFNFFGVNSIMFKYGITQPLNIPEGKEKVKNIESAEFWSDLASMQDIKAEIKARAGMNRLVLILYIIGGIGVITLLGTIYAVYEITQMTGAA